MVCWKSSRWTSALWKRIGLLWTARWRCSWSPSGSTPPQTTGSSPEAAAGPRKARRRNLCSQIYDNKTHGQVLKMQREKGFCFVFKSVLMRYGIQRGLKTSRNEKKAKIQDECAKNSVPLQVFYVNWIFFDKAFLCAVLRAKKIEISITEAEWTYRKKSRASLVSSSWGW